MGNRVYFTIKTKSESKTYYQHWNGGLDTFAPLAHALFANDVTDIQKAISFIESMGFRPELQESSEASSWLEENGHHFIDLDAKTFETVSASGMRRPIRLLREAFVEYVQENILAEYQESSDREYWHGIIDAAKSFFNGGVK